MFGWLYDRMLDLVDPQGPLATKEQRRHFAAEDARYLAARASAPASAPVPAGPTAPPSPRSRMSGRTAAALIAAGLVALAMAAIIGASGAEGAALALFWVGVVVVVSAAWLFLYDRFPTSTLVVTAALAIHEHRGKKKTR